MINLDVLYQQAVDQEAAKTLDLTVDDFLKIGDYGSIETTINGSQYSIGWWHYNVEGQFNHVVFIAERKLRFFFYRKYISGVKLEKGKLLKLTDEEIGNYD
jgi:hypothetical protein